MIYHLINLFKTFFRTYQKYWTFNGAPDWKFLLSCYCLLQIWQMSSFRNIDMAYTLSIRLYRGTQKEEKTFLELRLSSQLGIIVWIWSFELDPNYIRVQHIQILECGTIKKHFYYHKKFRLLIFKQMKPGSYFCQYNDIGAK